MESRSSLMDSLPFICLIHDELLFRHQTLRAKVLMQGKLIAVAYTPRTY